MRNNIFYGNSYYALFAQVTYKWLMNHKWVTYADIMADHLKLKSAKELPCNVSNCDNYGELKKAFCDIRKIISEKLGKECIEAEGNNRNRRFRYIGKEKDPLADMRNAKVIDNLKQYWQFCQDSAGFFPKSWLEYFFKDCQDLLDIKARKQNGEQVLSASLDRMLTNIELLPSLYEAIVHKQVLSIVYKPYDEEEQTLTFHPHYLKEFNGRWFLFGHTDEHPHDLKESNGRWFSFGHANEHEPEFGRTIALDRICSKPRELYNVAYTPAPKGFYEDYFKNIVGVSHMKDETRQPYQMQPIRIRAHSNYMYKLTETKKIHPSQEVVTPFGEHEDGTYGEFVVNVELNNEFIGRILQMGDGLEVVAPDEVRRVFKKRVANLAKLYDMD